jgi:hypothetical protein
MVVRKNSEYGRQQEASLQTSSGNKKRHNDIVERIDRQITCIEEVVAELLSGISIDEMSTYERLSIAIRFIGQHQRALALRQSCDKEASENRDQAMMSTLMSQMRGEDVGAD